MAMAAGGAGVGFGAGDELELTPAQPVSESNKAQTAAMKAYIEYFARSKINGVTAEILLSSLYDTFSAGENLLGLGGFRRNQDGMYYADSHCAGEVILANP
jgi:hypothetical protein